MPVLICAISIFVFILLAWTQAGKPLQLDNMDFPAVAVATADSGLPVYYRGEESLKALGLYHPPLYIYSLAGWFLLFGANPVTTRMFGVICAIIAGFLALQIVRTIFGSGKVREIAPVFFIFYLLNPFALQAFSIADIDTTIYAPLTLLAILASLRLVFVNGDLRTTSIGWRDYALLIFVFLLCFWSKLTTTVSLPLVFAAILSIRFGLWKSIAISLGIAVVTAVTFFFTYLIYGVVTGLDVGFSWSFLIQSLVSKSGGEGGFASTLFTLMNHFYNNFVNFVRWGLLFIIVFTIMAEIGFFFRVVNGGGRDRARSLAALGILSYAIFVTAAYSFIALPFGGAPFKYIVPVWPLIALASAAVIGRLMTWPTRLDRGIFRIGLVIGGVGLLAGLFWLRDGALLGVAHSLLRGSAVSLAVALVTVLCAYRRSRAVSVSGFFRNFALAVAAVVVGQSLGVAIYQARADHATQYDYGQTGFVEASDWVSRHTASNEVIMSMKDLGFAIGRRYLENYGYVNSPALDQKSFGDLVERLGIRVFVFTEERGQDQLAGNHELADWIARNTKKTIQFGNYVIYTKD